MIQEYFTFRGSKLIKGKTRREELESVPSESSPGKRKRLSPGSPTLENVKTAIGMLFISRGFCEVFNEHFAIDSLSLRLYIHAFL
jgi:hypothetical protein